MKPLRTPGRFLCYGGSLMLAGVIASASASATTLKIERHGGSVDATTASIVDKVSSSGNETAVGQWGKTIGTERNRTASPPTFFKVAKGPSGTVVVKGPGSDREVVTGNGMTVIPASLMARANPPGLQNTARGVNNMAPPEVTPVPLPAAAWLFISGLMGLFLIGRKRKRYAAAA